MGVAFFPPFPPDEVELATRFVSASAWGSLEGKRLFVTGGTGFVGKWLLAALQAAKQQFGFACEVVALSRDPAALERQAAHLAKAPGFSLLRGDVIDFDMPAGRFDIVIHAAADVGAVSTPLKTFNTCLFGTRRVLEFAARSGARDFLLISSGAVYGRQPSDLAAMAEHFGGAPDVMAANTGYGQGKRVAEWLANVSTREHGQRLAVARLFAFMGPGMPLDSQFAIANFMRDAMANAPIVIQGDGSPWRSYLHAADMAGWLWKILFEGRPNAAYNVGSQEGLSIASLAHRVKSALGSSSTIEIRGQPTAGASVERYVPDVRKAREELGLHMSIPLEEGIRRTADWHRRAAQAACA